MDEINGRQGSEAPSSSSDFYNTDVPDTQADLTVPPQTHSPMEQEDRGTTTIDPDDADDEDSEEMDVSNSSRASSAEPPSPPLQLAGAKRRLTDTSDAPPPVPEDEMSKRRKLSPHPPTRNGSGPKQSGHLPAEIWQRVFLHLPPAMLSRCLRVCRTFNECLTKTKAGSVANLGASVSTLLDSEQVWSHARKVFFPNLPRPLVRCSELEMLQLIGGMDCQFCHREPIPQPATSALDAGPGPDGLRVIWPFGVRACGTCIENVTLKDVQILVSKYASLRIGLPYIYLTPNHHFIPEIQRQQQGGIPSYLRVSKLYYQKDIEAIDAEFEDAKSFGEGAANEWRKGLLNKGKEAMADAARWEKWEAQMRPGSDLSQVLREYDLSSFPRRRVLPPQGEQAPPPSNTNVSWPPPYPVPNGSHMLPQPVPVFQNEFGMPFQPPISNPPYPQPYRQVRDPQEVEAVRQARKADIERRCLLLEPPLERNVLQHIESFQAAMQITAPMTDSAWDMLRPRILAQREKAELDEHHRQEHWAALQATMPFTVAEEAFIKPAKEIYDKEYEHAQEPLRKRLGEYAAEYIDLQWNGARAVDKDNAPTFAVQTMLNVRQRYLADKKAGALPAFDVPVRAGSKQGTPIPEPFLSLDNMKWVYDNKIRPLTDSHRRELFICAGCDERKPKWFAFEGLIQHYGAKHTIAFSKGNIIVHWQTSEWPDDPPFHQNPSQFIKSDRRTSDFKNHGRARNTPQANHESAFAPPGSSKLLSESPFFSSHAQQSPQGGANTHYNASTGYPAHQYSPGGHAAANSVDPSIDMSDHAKVNQLSYDARQVWDALEGVKELLECVRVYTAFHHAVTHFRAKFHQEPSLDLVTDALATNALIRPVKDANGLACKICVASQTDGSANYQSYFARIRNVKLYNASSLVTHFKIMHQPQQQQRNGRPYHVDWTKEMIELPETQIITDLARTPGMDDNKLGLVAAAFPDAFSHPLPRIGVVQESLQDSVGPDSGLASRLLNRLNKKPKGQQMKKKGNTAGPNGTSTPGREMSQELPEPKEDEYDPRRPMYLLNTRETNADPARFDTDLARKAPSVPPSSAMSPLASQTLSLDPGTLAALGNLSALALNRAEPSDSRAVERSPSVGGRAEDEPSPFAPASGQSGSPAAASSQPPDISAILASLTGVLPQQQHGSPPITGARNHQDGSNHALARYPPPNSGYRSSAVEYSPRYEGRDIYAAPSTTVATPSSYYQNLESFDHNRCAHHIAGYTDPVAASHHHHSHSHSHSPVPAASSRRSPPRYRYVVDDGNATQYYTPYTHPASVAALNPAYREQLAQQAVQYVHVASPPPDRAYAPQPPQQGMATYAYHRSAPAPAPSMPAPQQQRTVYVDEFGRELIPIVESAPAHSPLQTQQYSPQAHAYASQQQRYAQPVYYEYDYPAVHSRYEGGAPPQ